MLYYMYFICYIISYYIITGIYYREATSAAFIAAVGSNVRQYTATRHTEAHVQKQSLQTCTSCAKLCCLLHDACSLP